jgi:flagellar hook-associated protein 3 FlgL
MISRTGTGDMAMTTLLSRHSHTLRTELQTRLAEVSSGLKSDLTAAVGGDFSVLAAMDHSLQRLKGYAANTVEAGLLLDVAQNALEVVSSSATTLATDTLRTVGMTNQPDLGALANDARRVLDTAIAALNTRFTDKAVFAGVNTNTLPVPDAGTILSALQAATATATTVNDVMTAIDDWFMGSTGYEAAYAGGPSRPDAQIAPGETADLSVTALDPAIRASLRDMATLAMLDSGVLVGDPEAKADLARAAGEGLLSGGAPRSQLMARVGTTQAQIAAAATRNGAEETALGIARAGIVTADPYDAATRLEELQTRLEALYLITARVSRLSLSEYI